MQMNMKDHILAALTEQQMRWAVLLGQLDEQAYTQPLAPSPWSIKDHLAHLWAWQLRTRARVESAVQNRPPQFPRWPSAADPDAGVDVEATNAWIYAAHRDLPWAAVHADWRSGYLGLVATAAILSERQMLDSDAFPWLGGHSLAAYLLATYDHHQEHFEQIESGLRARSG